MSLKVYSPLTGIKYSGNATSGFIRSRAAEQMAVPLDFVGINYSSTFREHRHRLPPRRRHTLCVPWRPLRCVCLQYQGSWDFSIPDTYFVDVFLHHSIQVILETIIQNQHFHRRILYPCRIQRLTEMPRTIESQHNYRNRQLPSFPYL